MKIYLISFLFFCIYFSGLFFSKGFSTVAQTKKDSVLYHYNLATNPKTSNDLITSYIFFKKEKEESIKEKDTLNIVYYLRIIVNIESELGAFYDSEASAVEALKLLKPKNRQEKIGLYNHLGMIHRELRNYDDALFYYDKSLRLVKNSLDSSTVFNNIGNVYKDQKKYILAISSFKKAYQINWPIKDSLKSAKTLSNLGSSESKLNRSTALSNMLKALSIREKLSRDKYPSYKHLSQYYLDRSDTINALKYAKKGYKVAEKINSPAYKEDALSNLVDLGAYTFFDEYKVLKDSIAKANQLQENKFASAKYNFYEQEKIAKKNRLDKEQEQKLKILWQVIVVLIILLFIAIYVINKSRHKREKVEQVLKTEARISKKVHDEVANDVYHIMTKLQTNKNVKEDVLEYLEGIYNKTRDISK
ncbi:MAG: tetratricopeptide repeat protein, partial [Polaribacter sp.]